MSILSAIFGGAPTTPPATPAAPSTPAPGNIPPNAAPSGQSTAGAAPNGTIPPGTAAPDDANKTPLSEFEGIWKNEPPKAGEAPAGIFGNIDPKKFTEAAQRIDFTRVVTPEQMAAIQAGGEDATKALVAAMNAVAQTAYAQSAFASTRMIENAIGKAREEFRAELPSQVKRYQVSENLRNDNPIFSNPAVSPIISALEAQLTTQYPDASAAEITEQAKRYVEALGTSFAPQPKTTAESASGKKDQDWLAYIGEST